MTEPATREPTPFHPPTPGRMTYEQFLAWADEDTHAEWVNGEVVLMSPVSDEYTDLAGWLLALLRPFVEARDLGVIRHEPFQMKAGPDLPGRSPDLIFIASAHRPRLRKTYLEGPADLAVELVSPESAARDRGEKFYEYEKGGVREYWLLDQLRRQAEFYGLGEDRIFRLLPVDDSGTFRSPVIDQLWLKVDWLWQDPLPPVLTILREWGLV
jgi:Uma2 family endonuclease